MSTSQALDLIARQFGRQSRQFDHACRLAAYGRRSAIVAIAQSMLPELILAA